MSYSRTIAELINAQFRAEAFIATNTVEFGIPIRC